jgi:hypothetical protein
MQTTVSIPGTFYATYEDGKITGYTFTPSGSAAGYFGPSARVEDGDDDLDVEDTNGPFWRAVQADLTANGAEPDVAWQE